VKVGIVAEAVFVVALLQFIANPRQTTREDR